MEEIVWPIPIRVDLFETFEFCDVKRIIISVATKVRFSLEIRRELDKVGKNCISEHNSHKNVGQTAL